MIGKERQIMKIENYKAWNMSDKWIEYMRLGNLKK